MSAGRLHDGAGCRARRSVHGVDIDERASRSRVSSSIAPRELGRPRRRDSSRAPPRGDRPDYGARGHLGASVASDPGPPMALDPHGHRATTGAMISGRGFGIEQLRGYLQPRVAGSLREHGAVPGRRPGARRAWPFHREPACSRQIQSLDRAAHVGPIRSLVTPMLRCSREQATGQRAWWVSVVVRKSTRTPRAGSGGVPHSRFEGSIGSGSRARISSSGVEEQDAVLDRRLRRMAAVPGHLRLAGVGPAPAGCAPRVRRPVAAGELL